MLKYQKPFGAVADAIVASITDATAVTSIGLVNGARLYNVGSNLIYCKTGVASLGVSASAFMYAIPAGGIESISLPDRHAYFATICNSGYASTLHITVGGGL